MLRYLYDFALCFNSTSTKCKGNIKDLRQFTNKFFRNTHEKQAGFDTSNLGYFLRLALAVSSSAKELFCGKNFSKSNSDLEKFLRMLHPTRLHAIKSFCADHYIAKPHHLDFVYDFFELLLPIEKLVHFDPERFIRLLGQYVKGLLPRENNHFPTDAKAYKGIITEIYPSFYGSDLQLLCCRSAAIPRRRAIFYEVCDLVFEYFY